MNCEFCEKTFSNSQNCSRHIKTCKSNPNKEIVKSIITYSETDMLKKHIEILEKQKEDNSKFLFQLLDNIQDLQKQIQEKDYSIKILISKLENK
jgi:hypothetical protein